MAARRAAPAAPNTMAAKRIRREINDLARENLGDITLTPNESNIFLWRATIPGPQGSPYEGGVFDVDIRIPENYPFAPPQLQFLTKVYHCNINQNGAICLDLLKSTWSPALSLYKVILSLSSLLTDPNPGDPLVPAIANEYKTNRGRHDATAREWVKKYAQPKEETLAPPAAKPAPAAPSASRPRPIRRNLNGSNDPPAPLAGTRRSAPGTGGADSQSAITVVSDDEEDDDDGGVEILGGGQPSRKRARVEQNGHAHGNGEGTSGTSAGNNDHGSHEVIVIDD